MNYFEARRSRKTLESFKQLAESYWGSVEMLKYGEIRWMLGPEAPLWRDTPESQKLRETIHQRQAEVIDVAHELRAMVGGYSAPSAMIGGPTISFNLLTCVCSTWVGHSHVTQVDVRDAIDRAINRFFMARPFR